MDKIIREHGVSYVIEIRTRGIGRVYKTIKDTSVIRYSGTGARAQA